MATRPTPTPIPIPTPAPATPITTAPPLDRLEQVLSGLVTQHTRLLAHTVEHRRAISEADLPALRACLEEQGDLLQSIVALERERQGIVGAMIGSATPAQAGLAAKITMSSLAARAPEPSRTRLADVAAALRDVLGRLHHEHQALRLAATTLSTHMEGIMRQVGRSLSHAGTYARSGAVDSGVQVVSAFDVRS